MAALNTSKILASEPGCATVSIGAPIPGGNPPLEDKLPALAAAGFKAIELSIWDLQPFAARFLKRDVDEKDYAALSLAAKEVRRLCQKLQLRVSIMVACFQIEGWPRGSHEYEAALEHVEGYCSIMKAVGTDLLLLASSDASAEKITSSEDELAADLAHVADILAQHGLRVAYEDLCWATRASRWKQGWTLVSKANRPNLGICLDVFHIAALEWADPASASGVREESGREENFERSLQELSMIVDPAKVFFVQFGDAYKPLKPFADSMQDGLNPRGQWAQAMRPLPIVGKTFLPVIKTLKALLATGYEGPISLEIFDGGVTGQEFRQDSICKQCDDAFASFRDVLQAVVA